MFSFVLKVRLCNKQVEIVSTENQNMPESKKYDALWRHNIFHFLGPRKFSYESYALILWNYSLWKYVILSLTSSFFIFWKETSVEQQEVAKKQPFVSNKAKTFPCNDKTQLANIFGRVFFFKRENYFQDFSKFKHNLLSRGFLLKHWIF